MLFRSVVIVNDPHVQSQEGKFVAYDLGCIFIEIHAGNVDSFCLKHPLPKHVYILRLCEFEQRLGQKIVLLEQRRVGILIDDGLLFVQLILKHELEFIETGKPYFLCKSYNTGI